MEEARSPVSLCLHPPLSLAALSRPFQHLSEEFFFFPLKMMQSNPAAYLWIYRNGVVGKDIYLWSTVYFFSFI